jgi:hypothetical protein
VPAAQNVRVTRHRTAQSFEEARRVQEAFRDKEALRQQEVKRLQDSEEERCAITIIQRDFFQGLKVQRVQEAIGRREAQRVYDEKLAENEQRVNDRKRVHEAAHARFTAAIDAFSRQHKRARTPESVVEEVVEEQVVGEVVEEQVVGEMVEVQVVGEVVEEQVGGEVVEEQVVGEVVEEQVVGEMVEVQVVGEVVEADAVVPVVDAAEAVVVSVVDAPKAEEVPLELDPIIKINDSIHQMVEQQLKTTEQQAVQATELSEIKVMMSAFLHEWRVKNDFHWMPPKYDVKGHRMLPSKMPPPEGYKQYVALPR